MTRAEQLRQEAEARAAGTATVAAEPQQSTMSRAEQLRQEAEIRTADAAKPWYAHLFNFGTTAAKELGTGFVQGAAGTPDIIPNTVNTATSLKDQWDTQGGDPYAMEPMVGGARLGLLP